MNKRLSKFLSFMLISALGTASMPGITAKAAADESSYSIEIPDTLTITKPGWNELPGGIKASGTLEEGMKLVITPSTSNDFKLVNEADSSQTISYDLRASSTDTSPVESWSFLSLSSNPETRTVGVNVADYSGKAPGTYTEAITFRVEIDRVEVAAIVDLSTLTADYEAQDGDILTGTLNGVNQPYKITIADGASITLRNAIISGYSNKNYKWAGLTPLGDATIILSGDNSVTGFYENYPGIFVPAGKTLTIKGGGKLTADSNGYGAGIGGGLQIACGNIVIESGTITATGGEGAGIGGGYGASCGNITINGGPITANGGYYGAGIGSGDGSSSGTNCGNITINGGTITADGGYHAAGIGGGYKASCGNITITNTVTKVTATKGDDALDSVGRGSDRTCGTVTIGGTVYWDGTNYQNGGGNEITKSPYEYPAS